jgi:hypothetical protein
MRKMIAVAVLLVAAALLWPGRTLQAAKPCEVPKAWGPLRGLSNHSLGLSGEHTRLAFEDEAGTVRVLGEGCKLALEVTRIP